MCRDLRRPGSSSPVKSEDEGLSVGPPKGCMDVKFERMYDSQEQHSTAEKSALLSKSSVNIKPTDDCSHASI